MLNTMDACRSSRHLNRLRKERQEEKSEERSSLSSLEEEYSPVHKPKASVFNVLDDSDSDSDANSSSSDEEEDDGMIEDKRPPITTKDPSMEASEETDTSEVEYLNSVLAEMKEMGIDSSTSSLEFSTVTTASAKMNALFCIDKSCLDAEKEMKRLFGVKRDRGDKQMTKKQRHHHQRGGLGGRKSRLTGLRPLVLITPEESWTRPPNYINGGIRMTLARPSTTYGWDLGSDFFEFEMSATYEKSKHAVEQLFLMHDPNIFAAFVYKHPYQVDALLAFCQLLQHHGQMDQATELLKRALFVLECAWHERFNPWQGQARVDIDAKYNGMFFKALFRHMKMIGRRGCARSAFQMAKLILGLDPQCDPLGILFCIDYYALNAREYDFILQLYQSKLPIRYSRKAYILLRKSSTGTNDDNMALLDDTTIQDLPSFQFAVALALFFKNKIPEAKDALAQTLVAFPPFLRAILGKCNISTESGTWREVVCHACFEPRPSLSLIMDEKESVMSKLIELYVERSAECWKSTETQHFLYQGTLAAIALFESLPSEANVQKIQSSVYSSLSPLRKCLQLKAEDFSDEVVTLPEELLQQPPGHLNHAQEGQHGQDAQIAALLQQNDPEEIAAAMALMEAEGGTADNESLNPEENPLLLFLQTLLPWNHFRNPND